MPDRRDRDDSPDEPSPQARVWAALLAAAEAARRIGPSGHSSDALAAIDSEGRPAAAACPDPLLIWRSPDGWAPVLEAPAGTSAPLELYLPVCNARAERPVAVGHLGQSLDGYIATGSGDSHYVTGPENLLHLHRMRALCDAVIVGAETVARDDPRLTTRRAPGPNPVRVVLDPRRRLPGDRRVFTDGAAPTLVFADARRARGGADAISGAETIGVPASDGRLRLDAVLEALHERGLFSTFVEGGGATVSGFLEAGLLHRLQIAVAPLVMGRGRPGIRLPARDAIGECLRPAYRVFMMGRDVLFDCDLMSAAAEVAVSSGMEAGMESNDTPPASVLKRIF